MQLQGKGAKPLLVDVFGQVLTQQPRDEVTCIQCGRRIAASRYASKEKLIDHLC